MAEKGWINHSTLTAIANAIREKTGDTALLLPGAMAQAIRGMPVPDETVKQATVTTSAETISSTITFSGITGQPREWEICAEATSYDSGSSRYYVIHGSSLSNTASLIKATNSTVTIGTSDAITTYANANFSIKVSGTSYFFRGDTNYTLYYKI